MNFIAIIRRAEWHHCWMPLLVGGIGGGLVNLLYLWTANIGIEAKDWLQFLGVFAGVVFTIAATQLNDWRRASARERQAKIEFMLAARAVAEGLTSIVEQQNLDEIQPLVSVVEELWGLVVDANRALSNLDYPTRAKIAVASRSMKDQLAILRGSMLSVNFASVRATAKKMATEILPLTEIFEAGHHSAAS